MSIGKGNERDKYLKDIEKAPNTPRQYLGQPDMVQTKTGRLITAYPTGHGHGPIIMQISDDEGETWTEKKDIPASFATCQETPTLYTLDMGNGKERIMLISACPNWDLQRGGWDTAYSDDDGETWTEIQDENLSDFIATYGNDTMVSDIYGDTSSDTP